MTAAPQLPGLRPGSAADVNSGLEHRLSGTSAAQSQAFLRLRRQPDADIHFERLAVTPGQIEAWDLPTRPTKARDTRARGFGEISVELDAIEPDTLRTLVRLAIEDHLPKHQFNALKAAEESARALLRGFVAGLENRQ